MCYAPLSQSFAYSYEDLYTSVIEKVLGLSESGCEFDPRLRRLFFPAYFRLSPLKKHFRKAAGGFGKKSCISTGVRKPGNICVTDCHDMTLAVKVALNPNTTNQPTFHERIVVLNHCWTNCIDVKGPYIKIH